MRTQMKRALVFRDFAFRVLGLSLRTSQKQPFFFRVTSIHSSAGRQDSRNYWIQMRIIEYKYTFTAYKCQLLNTNIFLLNTNANYWIQIYFYWIQMRIIEYKYKLLNVKWCYWILQQFGNHRCGMFHCETMPCSGLNVEFHLKKISLMILVYLIKHCFYSYTMTLSR